MKYVKLGEVCDISMGQAPPGTSYNTKGQGLPLLAGAGDFGAVTPKPSKFTTAATKVSAKDDLVLCIRATIGDLNWSDKEYCLGRGVAGLRPHQGILDKDYLWHWIGASKAELSKEARGSTFKQVSKDVVRSHQIPLPPLAEQKRIAAILDKSDAIRKKRKQAIELTQQFLRSAFLEMFGDPVMNPKGWEVVKLKDITTLISDGVHQKPQYTPGGVPFISVKNITTGVLDFTECKFISAEAHQKYCKRCKPEYNDILYTKVGATYGRPAIIDTTDEFSIYVSVALIKPRSDLVDTLFLKEALASEAVKDALPEQTSPWPWT